MAAFQILLSIPQAALMPGSAWHRYKGLPGRKVSAIHGLVEFEDLRRI